MTTAQKSAPSQQGFVPFLELCEGVIILNISLRLVLLLLFKIIHCCQLEPLLISRAQTNQLIIFNSRDSSSIHRQNRTLSITVTRNTGFVYATGTTNQFCCFIHRVHWQVRFCMWCIHKHLAEPLDKKLPEFVIQLFPLSRD